MSASVEYIYICTACGKQVVQHYHMQFSHPQLPSPAVPEGWNLWQWGQHIGGLYCPDHMVRLTIMVDGETHEVLI
jgi:hypothetical protein